MSIKRFMNKKVVAIGLAAGITLGGAGAAFAYFTASGAGTGQASVGTGSGLTIAQVGSVTGIVPDGAAHTVNYTVTNPTAAKQAVGQVTVTIASISGAGTLTGPDPQGNTYDACTPDLFTVTQGDPLNTVLNASTGHASGTATVALTDDGNNQDNCQGATLHLSFSAAA